MKSANELMARIGGNMKESMGATRQGGGGGQAAPPAFHGETAKYQGASRVRDALSIDLERIAPDPGQPRKEFDDSALADLAASLKARGQLQPCRVRWDGSVSRWIIVVGERRYRAAKLAGLPSLLCIEAKGDLTPDDILEDQLVENCLRQDLQPVEQARAFRALIDRRGWTYRQLAESLHIGAASVARSLALLDLPATVQDQVEQGVLPPATAYELSRVESPDDQTELAARVVAEGLTRAETVEAVRRASGRKGGGKGRGRKMTSRVFRKAAGYSVTFECPKGVDGGGIRVALAAVLARLDAEAEERDAA